MSRIKDAMIEDMEVEEVNEMLNNHRASQDTGYIRFLETQLEKAETLIRNMHGMFIGRTGPQNDTINAMFKEFYDV